MSEYMIKPYDESHIEKQLEIGNYYAQKWITYSQTSVEQVKNKLTRKGNNLAVENYIHIQAVFRKILN